MRIEAVTSGVILAGGRARRLGGRDKGLLELDARPLIEHVIQRLAPQVERLLINANRNQQRYADYGYPVFPDALPDHPGPLAGMLAAMQQTATHAVLCVPCDSPWLPMDLAARLHQALRTGRAEIACAHDGTRLHPVFALLKSDLRDPLQHYLDKGGRRVGEWFASRRLVAVDFSDCPERFANINTPQDLRHASKGPRQPDHGGRSRAQ